MAGYIRFYDSTSRVGLIFADDTSDAARRYGTCPDDSKLDFNTNDFAVEIVFYWSGTIANQSDYKVLVAKAADPLNLAAAAGWSIQLQPSNQRLLVAFNDGSADQITFYWDSVCVDGVTSFLRLEFDRDVGCSLYKNGVLVSAKSDITTRTGSVANASALTIGGKPGTATSYLKGMIDRIRFDTGPYNAIIDGVLTEFRYPVGYGATWNLENYYRWLHWWPETLEHYRAAWYFNNSLVDSSSHAFTFAFKDGTGASATPTYSQYLSGDGYTFAFDPVGDSGHSWGPIDLNSRQRGLDGTMKVYRGPQKRQKSWKFRTTSVEQIYALLGAWYAVAPLNIHDHIDKPFDFRGYLTAAPEITEVMRIGEPDSANFSRLWEIDLELEEA